MPTHHGADTLRVSVNNGPEVPCELSVETEQVDVTVSTKTEPNMRWEYVDEAGHFHAWAIDGTLPTLDQKTRTVEVPADYDDDEDWEYEETYYTCKICGEAVQPELKVTHPTHREYAPGRTSWTVRITGPMPAVDEAANRGSPGQLVSVQVAGAMTSVGAKLLLSTTGAYLNAATSLSRRPRADLQPPHPTASLPRTRPPNRARTHPDQTRSTPLHSAGTQTQGHPHTAVA